MGFNGRIVGPMDMNHLISQYGYAALVVGSIAEGETITLLGGVAAVMDVTYSLPLWQTIPVVIALGLFFGLLVGWLTAYLGIPSFIVTLGGQLGTTGYFAIKAAQGVEAKSYDEVGLAMEDLNVGRIAAVVCDDPVAANYALDKYKDKLKIAAIIETGEAEHYGVAVSKGSAETLALIDKGIKAVKTKGIDKDLKKKWIGQ